MRAGSNNFHGYSLACLLGLVVCQSASGGSFGDLNLVTTYCPPPYLQFWDTVVFTVAADRLANSRGEPDLLGGTEYDVKVPRDVDSVGDLRQLVADQLNTHGFTAEDGPVMAAHVGQLVHVDSAVVCGIPANLRLPAAGQVVK